MVTLFGQSHGRRDLLRRLPHPMAACGVRLLTLGDGAERGVRMLEMRTGSGLDLGITIDRCMDIGELSFRGIPLGWQMPTGFRAPWLTDLESEGGLGFNRSFSGFWITCGFDHMRRATTASAAHFNSVMRDEMTHPLHGRGALTPAVLRGYGADWVDDRLLLWAEGDLRQVFMFGENLFVRRRIEAWAGEAAFSVTDVVTNDGFIATPHMLLYHINAGWPLLDEGARIRVPIAETVHPAPPLPPPVVPAPQPANLQTVQCHRVHHDGAGRATAALLNDRLGLGLAVDFDAVALPWFQEWRCYAEGVYALGLEPLTNRIGTRDMLEQAGEIRLLAPGESVTYLTRISVADGADAMTTLESRIAAMQGNSP